MRSGQKAVIVPSETKGIRTKPFTDEEFWAELARLRQQRIEDGLPLTDPTAMAVGEKAGRIAAYEARCEATRPTETSESQEKTLGAIAKKTERTREMAAQTLQEVMG